MRVNLDFKFSLYEQDFESGGEIEPQYEHEWNPEFRPIFPYLEIECSDPNILIGMSEQENSEDEVQILKR
jgi:hypothetical protein